MRLEAPLRGVIYGLSLVVGIPLAWAAGNKMAALLIGAVALFGIGAEATVSRRKDQGR